MEVERLAAEWLNACDAIDRIGDQIQAADNDAVAKSYVGKQSVRAIRYCLRLTFMVIGELDPVSRHDLQRALSRALFKLDDPNVEMEATGSRRGR